MHNMSKHIYTQPTRLPRRMGRPNTTHTSHPNKTVHNPHLCLQTSNTEQQNQMTGQGPAVPWININIYIERVYTQNIGSRTKGALRTAEWKSYAGGSPKRVSVPAGMKRSPRRKGVSTEYVLSMQSKKYRNEVIIEVRCTEREHNNPDTRVLIRNTNHA